ncbi:MAG: YcxB family protein [Lachnospiraceae bacterium]|nr:YcxB family protein [Lachnospiraceae bacterium]
MEVEFDIQMTSADLYDYMLHHTYNSAQGLIGSVAGALMIVAAAAGAGILCLIAGMIVLLYLPITLFLKSKQQFLMNASFKRPLHFKMTEEGIEVSQGEETQSQKWEEMHRAVSTMKSIILYTSPVNASIFPRRELGEKIPGVIEMISTHMPSSKVKIRC